MKIAIYEKVHLELIIGYAELLDKEDVSVSFITSALFKNDLRNILAQQNSRYTWYFIEFNEGSKTFFKKIYSVLKSDQYDLLILNSIDSKHLILFMILALSRPKRILINLHDINNFFKIKLSVSIRTNIRSLGKKFLTQLTNGYIVNSEFLKEYIIKNRFTKKPVYWLQPIFYKPSIAVKKTTFSNTIVVPGSIDKKRRDYELVLYVIQEMLRYRVGVKWILAGRPIEDYGAQIIEKATELNTKGAKISFSEDEIPEDEFQQIVANSSLIFSPLVSSTIFQDNIAEVYGESKASGNVYDAIRHAKPLIVPAAITVPEEIATSCIRYQSKENLVEQLIKIFTDPSFFADLEQKAAENSSYFSKEKIKSMFIAALKK